MTFMKKTECFFEKLHNTCLYHIKHVRDVRDDLGKCKLISCKLFVNVSESKHLLNRLEFLLVAGYIFYMTVFLEHLFDDLAVLLSSDCTVCLEELSEDYVNIDIT